jgi:hypothetical protein
MVRADGGGSIHACGCGVHPCQFQFDLIGAGVGRRDAMIFIYLKTCCGNMLVDVRGLIATVLHSSDGPTPLVVIVRQLQRWVSSNKSFARCYSGLRPVGIEVYCSSV